MRNMIKALEYSGICSKVKDETISAEVEIQDSTCNKRKVLCKYDQIIQSFDNEIKKMYTQWKTGFEDKSTSEYKTLGSAQHVLKLLRRDFNPDYKYAVLKVPAIRNDIDLGYGNIVNYGLHAVRGRYIIYYRDNIYKETLPGSPKSWWINQKYPECGAMCKKEEESCFLWNCKKECKPHGCDSARREQGNLLAHSPAMYNKFRNRGAYMIRALDQRVECAEWKPVCYRECRTECVRNEWKNHQARPHIQCVGDPLCEIFSVWEWESSHRRLEYILVVLAGAYPK